MARVMINGMLYEKHGVAISSGDVYRTKKCVQVQDDCELICMYLVRLLCEGNSYEDAKAKIYREYNRSNLSNKLMAMQSGFDRDAGKV